ncbi:2Fe-2S iron-sulfur cluster-binding protein [Streptantibioticus parmotrematis]
MPTGGRIDRSRTLTFRFDGVAYTGHPGDTLASALLACGVRQVATSIKLGRARGVFGVGSEEPNALVRIEAPYAEAMVTATTVELCEGLVAFGLPGRGRLPDGPDPARYDAVYAHCDVLVVGAGPTGLAAALTAARTGARVVLADENGELGGSLLGRGAADDWVTRARDELAGFPQTRVLRRTTVFGYYDDNYLLALERRTAHLGAAAPAHVSRERVWRIRAGRVVLATGAHERPIAFADNDRPGVMLASAAWAYVHRFGVAPGRRAVVFTACDSGYPAALDLAAAGTEVAAIVDARPQAGPWAQRARDAGLPVRAGHAVTGTSGDPCLTSVAVRELRDGEPIGPAEVFDADTLLVSGGWNPTVHLFSQAGGTLCHDPARVAFVPRECRQAVEVVGSAAGAVTLAECVADGARAGARAANRGATEAGLGHVLAPPPDPDDIGGGAPPVPLWLIPGPDEPRTHFVDLQRDVTVADLRRATGAGLSGVEHLKRYTTAGTAHDQGKTSGVLTTGVAAHLLGVEVSALGTTTYRPPYTPVPFAALAGRDRGALHDPVRVTALHDQHLARDAVFENVGQWKRPWYYPLAGEDMAAAVARECRAAREGVAFMDASTLGKIDVQGADAGVFLDRLYTNMISTLRPGRIRYGVMCRADGMVLDDGTVLRIADDRFLVTTTTGNAAAVLEWMEEWLQTEWPQLRVHCASVTEQWATVALVGPRSREVLSALAPQLPASSHNFPFMAWRDTRVAGVAARVCRISFSGELAYEINVPPWYAPHVWEAIARAGAPYAITPYGTETMHVLRAEKGYPVVGQDTDGTVTPQDLGLGWAVSAKKRDFVGKRSHARADTARPDRKQLVALLPDDRHTLLPEGGQVVADSPLPAPPVPMLGHVTSSYRSPALGRTFALALVRGGRERVGQRMYVPVGSALVPVTVAEPVLYDPEGARRDG